MKFKTKIKERALAFVLAISLICTMIPLGIVMAEQEQEETSALTKTAEWTDANKENVKITLKSEDISGQLKGKVLFLGSLCPNHDLTRDNIVTAMAYANKYADVDYHLFQTNKKGFDTAKAVEGTLKKSTQTTINAIKTDISKVLPKESELLVGSTHHTIYDFAKVLNSIKEKYDYIVMEFDGFLLGEYDDGKTSPAAVPSEVSKAISDASKVLAGYYDIKDPKKNKVIWIIPKVVSSNGNYMYHDKKFDNSDLKANIRNSVRETLKLLAPEDLDSSGNVKNVTLDKQENFMKRITAASDSEDRMWANYGEGTEIETLLSRKFAGTAFKTVKITDTLNDGFLFNEKTPVVGEYYDEAQKKWIAVSGENKFTYKIEGQKVVGEFTVLDYGHTQVRMFINCHVDSKNDPFTDTVTKVDTNKGNATAEYYEEKDPDNPSKTYTAEPPQLEKIRYKITTEVTGGTTTTPSITAVDGTDATTNFAPTSQYYDLKSITIDGVALTKEQAEALKGEKTFEDIMENHTVAVVYELPKVTVKFHPQNGESDTSDDINKGEKAEKPQPNPQKTGYTFSKWTTDKAGKNAYDFSTPVTSDLDLYAQYTEDDVTIKYEAATGGKVSKAEETIKADTGKPAGSTATPDTGYTFNKWENGAGDTVSTDLEFVPEKDTDSGIYEEDTYTAYFTINNYTVSFDNNDHGTNPQDQKKDYGQYADDPGSLTEAGYTFGGWYTDDETFENKYDFKNTPVTKSITLYAKWTENQITYNYKANTGGSVDSDSETIGADTGKPAGSEATADYGYKFVNWTNAEGGEVSKNTEFVPQKSGDPALYKGGTFYANFETLPYTVDFDTNGHGTKPQDQTVYYLEKATDPGDLSAAGYTFGGWFKDDGTFKNPFVFDEEKITKDTTVYAKWTENQVTYNYKANTGGSVDSDSETIGADTGKPAGSEATADYGYKFVNWTNSEGGEVSKNTEFIPQKSGDPALYKGGTFYANFETAPFTVKFVTNGHGIKPQNQTVKYLEKATDPGDLSAAGYTFGGWFKDDGTFKVPFVFDDEQITKDTTVYAKWTQDEVTINYVAQDGGKVSNAGETIGADTGKPAGSEATANSGYAFKKWIDADGFTVSENEKFVPGKSAQTGLYENATYTAVFDKKSYTVKFNVNGHGEKPANQTVKYLEKATDPGKLTADGYEFINWFTDKTFTTVYDFNTPIKKDTTIYAKWKTVVEFVDPTGPGTPTEDESVNVGGKANSRNPRKEGFDFGGFFKDPECTIPYDFDEEVDEPIKVYAKWTENVAKLKYDPNGGVSGNKSKQTLKYTKSAEVEGDKPTRKGYKFKGWAISLENAEAGIVDFKFGDEYKASNVVPKNGTLYAVWKKVSPKTGESNDFYYFMLAFVSAFITLALCVILKRKKVH